MEVKKPKVILRKRHNSAIIIDDEPKENEGRLFITIGPKCGVRVGEVRIHAVKAVSGPKGTPSQLRLMFIGPKSVEIKRIPSKEKV